MVCKQCSRFYNKRYVPNEKRIWFKKLYTIWIIRGTLGSANAYGTKRPNSRCFCSRIPGFGPIRLQGMDCNDNCWYRNVYPGTGTSYDPQQEQQCWQLVHTNYNPGDTVRLTTASLTFSCTQDGNVSQIAYPRTTDPAAGKELLVEAVTPTIPMQQ